MKSLWKYLSIAAAIVVICAAFSANTQAYDWSKTTHITTNQPIEIPGNIVLPAGSYTLKLLDLVGSRNVVQVFNDDQSRLYNTVFAIPDYRLEPAQDTHVSFYEHQAGQVPAIRSWVTAGSLSGLDFVYPKARANELAMITGENVPSDASLVPAMDSTPQAMPSDGDLQSDDKTAPDAAPQADGVASPADGQSDAVEPQAQASPDDTSAPAVTPSDGQDGVAAPQDQSAPTSTAAPATADSAATPAELPKTAGVQELLLLIGMGSSVGALALRRFRR